MFLFIKMKKVYVIVCSILIITILCLNKSKIIQVSTIPLSDPTYVIIVDAGHGEPDGGALSKTGIKESDINLCVAKELENELDKMGYSVLMTRNDKNNIADSDKQQTIRQMKISDLRNRVKIINDSEADMCISIHMNNFASSKYRGWQAFYNVQNENSKCLAELIQEEISKEIKKENKREALSIKNIKLTDEAKIPTVIVECGFLSNPDELQLLQTDEYRKQLVKGIVNGITRYYEILY